jgi:hypothetical protein
MELRHYALHPDALTLKNMPPDDRVRVVPGMHSIRLEPAMEARAAAHPLGRHLMHFAKLFGLIVIHSIISQTQLACAKERLDGDTL